MTRSRNGREMVELTSSFEGGPLVERRGTEERRSHNEVPKCASYELNLILLITLKTHTLQRRILTLLGPFQSPAEPVNADETLACLIY